MSTNLLRRPQLREEDPSYASCAQAYDCLLLQFNNRVPKPNVEPILVNLTGSNPANNVAVAVIGSGTTFEGRFQNSVKSCIGKQDNDITFAIVYSDFCILKNGNKSYTDSDQQYTSDGGVAVYTI
jgi:hypothetical protein